MENVAQQLEPAPQTDLPALDAANEAAIQDIRRLITAAKQEMSDEQVTLMMGAVNW